MLGISGELLSSKGVDAAATERTGTFGKERATKEVRLRFEDTLRKVIQEASNGGIKYINSLGEEKILTIEVSSYPFLYEEILAFCKFCYYTGTRKMAALNAKFDNPKNMYNGKLWTINIIDKGRKGGHHWEKFFADSALVFLKEYAKMRFNLIDDNLEISIRTIGNIFPTAYKYEFGVRGISKLIGIALKLAGKETEFPTHIWRHTFAQDGLSATNYNYELVATLGGWDSTTILKKCYGNMSDDAKLNGLKRMMGEKIEEKEPTFLRW